MRPGELIVHDPLRREAGDTLGDRGIAIQRDGRPLHLTSVGMRWRLETAVGASVLLLLSLGDGIEVIDGPRGKARIIAIPARTAVVPAGTYYDSLRVIFPGGTVLTQWRGEFCIGGRSAKAA